MLSYLSSLTIGVWLLTIVAQFWVCLLLRKGSAKEFRAFRAYIYVYAVGCPAAFLVAAAFRPRIYFIAYYVLTLTTDILVFFVGHEIYCKVFGPRMALPRFVPERTAAMMAISFSAAVALSLLLNATTGGSWTRWLVTTEQLLTAAAFATFWILFTYAKSLRIEWPVRVLQVWIGFALYLTVEIIAVFIRARASIEVAVAADRAAQIANLVAVTWWGLALRRGEDSVAELTVEEIGRMRAAHKHTMEGLRKSGSLKTVDR